MYRHIILSKYWFTLSESLPMFLFQCPNQRLSNVVHVQTKSKYHKALNSNSSSIVSIHSIVGDVPNSNLHRTGSTASATASASSNSTSSNLSNVAPVASVTSTTSYLLTADTAPSGGQRIHHQQLPVVMMSSAMPKMSTLSSLLSTPPSSTMTSTSSG